MDSESLRSLYSVLTMLLAVGGGLLIPVLVRYVERRLNDRANRLTFRTAQEIVSGERPPGAPKAVRRKGWLSWEALGVYVAVISAVAGYWAIFR